VDLCAPSLWQLTSDQIGENGEQTGPELTPRARTAERTATRPPLASPLPPPHDPLPPPKGHKAHYWLPRVVAAGSIVDDAPGDHLDLSEKCGDLPGDALRCVGVQFIRTMPGDADAEDKARLGRARALGVQESVIIGHSGCCL